MNSEQNLEQSRVKEVGIRKVLSASVSTITTPLSKDFISLVIIAFVIASPVAAGAHDRNAIVNVCFSRITCYCNCFGNSWLPGNKSGDCISGKEFENRINRTTIY